MSWDSKAFTTSMAGVRITNTNLGSSPIDLNNIRVRNICNLLTSNTTISIKDINIATRLPLVLAADSATSNVGNLSSISIQTSGNNSDSLVDFEFYTNGQAVYRTYTTANGYVNKTNFAWRRLTGDTNSGYTIEVNLISGAALDQGPALDTQHDFSTTRLWRWRAFRFGNSVGTTTTTAEALFTIRLNGVVGPYRRFNILAQAQVT